MVAVQRGFEQRPRGECHVAMVPIIKITADGHAVAKR